jgi:hypothetical protein
MPDGHNLPGLKSVFSRDILDVREESTPTRLGHAPGPRDQVL